MALLLRHVSVQVTTHVVTAAKNKKGKSTDKKDTKTKEFLHMFRLTPSAYLKSEAVFGANQSGVWHDHSTFNGQFCLDLVDVYAMTSF